MDEILRKIENKRAEYETFLNSEQYLQEKRFLDRVINDFLEASHFCVLNNSRVFRSTSLLYDQIDLIYESVVILKLIVKEGALNPIKRELRFILEAVIKYLYIDTKHSDKELNDKIKIYGDLVSRSRIDEVDAIKIFAFDEEFNKQFINEVKRVYSVLCKYVHPSQEQILEYKKRVENGSSIGYESLSDLKSVSNIIFQVLELVLVMMLEGLGPSYAGDLCVYFFDEKQNWKFRKRKFLKKLNSFFDYKCERQK